MRLHNLKISGFKSFPERSNLTFDDGVTAIVGPNGCGKSNVIDAITWVLGEQSAKSLRGERMEDVIFSGSDARKAIGTAEVTLNLAQVAALPGTVVGGEQPLSADLSPESVEKKGNDDADLDALLPLITRDVEVGRRLYRSGESEYLIDGRVCRLRDVQDLLMDSGIGVKAYAVIEQGKIGQILGARPTERRQLLEEAAGVTKYKSRRRAAELKLESAQQNLTRVDDIIFEVEKQRRALKRQAAKARRYRRLREELRRWETVGFATRHRQLAASITLAQTDLERAREREQSTSAQLALVDGDRERFQIELVEADTSATSARDSAHSRELEVERRQQQIEFDGLQIDALAEALANMSHELEDLRSRKGPARTELEAQVRESKLCVAERDKVANHLDEKQGALAQAQQALDGLGGDVEAARSEVFAAVNAATALQHAVEHANDGQVRLGETLAKLDAEASDLNVEAQTLAAGFEKVDAAEENTSEAIRGLKNACVTHEAELALKRSEREVLSGDLRELEHGLAEFIGRLTSLQDLEATRADYSEAARMLLSDAGAGVNHFGSVADHLEVKPGYERAVESCLGDILQFVVVPARVDAEAGLAFTRSHGVGRVGFLILEASKLGEEKVTPATEVDPLAKVVKVEGPGADAVKAVLENRWLSGSFEAAARVACQTMDPVATVEGDVFYGPAVVDGGTKKSSSGILVTKREIKELEVQIEGKRDSVSRLHDDISACDAAIVRVESALEERRVEQYQHEKSMLGHEMYRSSLNEDMDRLTKKQGVIKTERLSVEEEREALEARRIEAKKSIDRLEDEQRIADERFMSAQRLALDARESIDALGSEVAEMKAGHAALCERTSGLESSVSRLERASQDLDSRLEHRAAEYTKAQTNRQALISGVQSLKGQIDLDVSELASLREDVRKADEKVLGLRERLEKQDEAVRAARDLLEQDREEVSKLDMARASAEGDLSHLEESCVDTLQLTLDEVAEQMQQLERDGLTVPDSSQLAAEEREPSADENIPMAEEVDGEVAPETGASKPELALGDSVTVDDMVTGLREKLDRLGPVNMMAIEEFDDLDERFDFLTSQKEDLVESIRATGDAIARINKTTRERFREAFDAINGHFQETFSTLFGGGRAGLVLLDETDLLESGIDIIAQPPGKRLQSIQLLSGGEKALSAMSLMFAIFKYKPSPFCLLDEIDAPLDEANIGRFVEMLRGMQSETQFILVTHNRKTMEIADRLYGVTMEEPGVSKLISVQLGQA
ncbi:MAG: chromosome segregation protein SMC [Acidobacteria bacterium]|nr:chromosome segregation protein SMC [Acidobacteriota bacterium]|tara:strand:- start:7700 stop:11470 length:3771 start_codon:yes stop_codon:yes gene_type:complete